MALSFLVGRFRPTPETQDEGEIQPAAVRIPRRHRIVMPCLTGVGLVLAYLEFRFSWQLVLACAFIAVMVMIAFIDFYFMIIPNKIVLPAALIGLAAAIVLRPDKWWHFLMAAVGSALFLLILAVIWPGGMGMGDVKLALLMGGVLGIFVVVAMFLAFLLGALVGLALIASKRKTRKDAIPFGPYLALGSVVALLYGNWLAEGYLGLMS